MRELKLDVDSLYYLLKSSWLVPADRRSKPRCGDIVIEFSRFKQDSTMIGKFLGFDGRDNAYLIEGLNGERQKWHNAEVIVVKACEPINSGAHP